MIGVGAGSARKWKGGRGKAEAGWSAPSVICCEERSATATFPQGALWCLLALVIVGSAVYWRGYEAGSIVPTSKDAYDSFAAHKMLPGYYDSFHALPYSLENSFPLVKLGVQDKWVPGPDVQGTTRQASGWTSQFLLRIASPRFLRWFRWLQICAGWILATLFVAGVTGVIRKD